MRALVYHDRAVGFDTIVSGLVVAGHRAAARTTRMFAAREAEPADLVVVNVDDPRGRAISAVYRARNTITVDVARGLVPGTLHIWPDTWPDYAPPFPAPPDRANRLNLRALLRADGDVVYLDGDPQPVAKLEDGTDFHAWLNRIGYSLWRIDEFSTGAPFRWLLDVLAGVWVPVSPSQTAPIHTAGSAPSTDPTPNPGSATKRRKNQQETPR